MTVCLFSPTAPSPVSPPPIFPPCSPVSAYPPPGLSSTSFPPNSPLSAYCSLPFPVFRFINLSLICLCWAWESNRWQLFHIEKRCVLHMILGGLKICPILRMEGPSLLQIIFEIKRNILPVWNLMAVIWFHLTISSLVLLYSLVSLSVIYILLPSGQCSWTSSRTIFQYFSLRNRLFCVWLLFNSLEK